jgi:hypothetical protein
VFAIVFNLNSDEFRAVLYKGLLYEDLNLKDAENVYYRKALGLVNNMKLFKSDSVIAGLFLSVVIYTHSSGRTFVEAGLARPVP